MILICFVTNLEQTTSQCFSVGYTFYYWQYYYSTDDGTKQPYYNQNDHLGYTASQLHIKPNKYNHLKEELLFNKIHVVSRDIYEHIMKKATKYMQSKTVKCIKAAKLPEPLHYDIKPDDPITLSHISAVLFYTDLTSLSTAFSSTFRSLHDKEEIHQIMERNREYRNWSKLIREAVQIFGNAVGIKKRGPFFTGMSYMTIPSYVIRLCGPTSTTRTFEVAINFSTSDGIVMKINNGSLLHSQYLRYFNCSWLSCFNDEDERLFCGGNYPLRVESVIMVATNANFCLYFKSLFYFDCMVSGMELSDAEKNEMNTFDYKVLQRFIWHKMDEKKNKFEDYINETFKAFCDHKQQIVINLKLIHKYFVVPPLKNLIFEIDSNQLKTDLVQRIFTNCKTLMIVDPSGIYEFKLPSFLNAFVDLLKMQECMLEKIVIEIAERRLGDNNNNNSWLNWECDSTDFKEKINEEKECEFKLKRQRTGDGTFDVLTVSLST